MCISQACSSNTIFIGSQETPDGLHDHSASIRRVGDAATPGPPVKENAARPGSGLILASSTVSLKSRSSRAMKIFFSPSSPFVRKVLVSAHELGLAERIERLKSAAHPINRDQTIIAHNPLGQVPTFFADDGRVLYDSRVICEYLDTLA